LPDKLYRNTVFYFLKRNGNHLSDCSNQHKILVMMTPLIDSSHLFHALHLTLESYAFRIWNEDIFLKA